MDFKHEKYFTDAINSGSIQEIKVAICMYIDKDASDSNDEIKNIVKYLDSKDIDIWQQHKDIEFIKPKEHWDIDYLALLQSDLMYNFSRERLNLIMEVGRYIYDKKQSISSNIPKYQNCNDNSKELSKSNRIYSDNNDKENLPKNNKYISDSTNNQHKEMINTTYSNKSNEMKSKHNRDIEMNNKNKSNANVVLQNNNTSSSKKLKEDLCKATREIAKLLPWKIKK